MGTEQGLCLGVTGKLVEMKGMLGPRRGRHAMEPMQNCSKAWVSEPGVGW